MNEHVTLEQYTQWFFQMKHSMSGIDEFAAVFLSILFLAIIVAAICGIASAIYSYRDKIKGSIIYEDGTIIDKKYIGETNTTGTGVGVASNGGLAVVSTSSHEDEQFLLFVQGKNTSIHKVKTNMDYYYHCKIGNSQKLEILVGGLTHKNLKVKLV